MRLNARVGAGVIIHFPMEFQDDRFLVLRRKRPSRRGGMWETPGGKLEPGETLTQAAIREAMEETGIEARVQNLAALFSSKDPEGQTFIFAIFNGYSMTGSSGIRLSSEHSEHKIVTPGEALGLPGLAPRLRMALESRQARPQALDGWKQELLEGIESASLVLRQMYGARAGAILEIFDRDVQAWDDYKGEWNRE